ncbi:MAG: BspA family leucine-rich repeat surface protein [Cyclobacteriaceae bacterium]
MVIRPLFKLAFFAIIIGFTFFSSTSAVAQTVTATDLGTSNVTIYKTSKQLVYGFGISATGGDATLTALTTQATGGTYSSSDIVNFELYFNNTANDFRSATLVGTSGPSTGTGEGINFGSFSQVITGDGTDRYFYIAINVAAGATSGNTFSIPFLDATNFTFSALVTFTPALGPSGTKTIQNAITYTSVPTANATNAAVASNIELDFDANVNLITVHNGTTNPDDFFDDNIKIIGSQSGQFSGVFSFGADNSIVIFNPSISFKAGEKVTVTVNSYVAGAAGEAAAARSFSFIAASGPFEGGYKERPTAGILGVVYGNSDWGDYDGDGDLDVVVTGFDPAFNQIAVIYNNVNGVFTDSGAILTGVSDSACEWGDFDGDGDLDLVIAGLDASFTNRIAKIYRNDGGSTFTDIGAGLTGVDFASIDWGDYDNDGDLDLVIAGRYLFSPDFHSTTIYRNDGGVFTDIGASITGVTDGSADWGDYDADGDLDLLITGFDDTTPTPGRHFTIYRNDGGSFSDIVAGLPGFGFSAADWGDYDNDGDLDIAVMGGKFSGTDGAFIYQNTAGVFTDINAGLPDDIEEGSIQWGDYDGDGDLDLLLTGQDYSPGDNITSAIFRNDAGLFTNINASLEGVTFQSVGDWLDFDGDGDLDLFVAGENIPGDIVSKLYENTVFNAFVTTWKTDNPGSSNDNQITIPTTGTGYLYNVNWGDGMTDTDVTGDITHTYAAPGTYTVSITGAFPRIYFNAGSFLPDKDSKKILTVQQWGDVAWTSMRSAFSGCEFLRINAADAPDLSNVTDMYRMFYYAESLNDDINHWDVSNVTNMSGLFSDAAVFNQPLNTWDVSNVTNMNDMFSFARDFNQDLSFVVGGANTGGDAWNTSNVQDMSSMFGGASAFNQPIGNWNVSNVTNMNQMFSVSAFNQDIGNWNVSKVTNMGGMFNGTTNFNQDISFKPGGGNYGGDAWNTTLVTNMVTVFGGTQFFNQDIGNWIVDNVNDMRGMFDGAIAFNQDISGWNVGKVNDMQNMFESATSFNQDISGWNVTLVNDMSEMFSNATAFNQDLGRVGGWDVSGVSDMRLMFENASSFDQDLSGWDVTNLNLAVSMFNNSGLSVSNYDKLLEGWAALPVRSNVSFGAQGIYYCSAQAARDVLTTTFNWNITDGGPKCITLFDGPDTTAPEIVNAQPEAIDFGSTSTSKSRTFTLLNNQDIPITNVQINNASPGFPSVVVFVSIAAGATQSFTIDLTGPIGTYTETVSITSDDFSGSFQFDVTGEVTAAPEPEIAVFEGVDVLGTPILSGQPAPLDMGYEIKGNSLMSEFTITNIGDAALNISDITFTGSAFVLGSVPPTTVPVNGTETVQVILSGISAGIFFETVSVLSDDTDEAIFNFNVYGEIIGPDIAVYNGTDIYSDPEIFDGQVAPVDFGSGSQGADIIIPITIANWNPADLNISNVTITGSAFTLTSAPPTFVAAEVDGIISFVTFDIMLSGVTAGTFNETVTIFNDDDDEPTFSFQLTGTIISTGCVTPPTASVGIVAAICEGSTIVLAGSIGGSATVSTWSTGGDGGFDNTASLNAVYTPGPTDISNGTVTLSLSTDDPDGAGPCNAATALAFVNIGRTATVDAGVDQTICTTDIATVTGTMGQAANNPNWTTSGTGTFSSPNALTSDYTPSPADVSSGAVTLTLTVDATGVCPQAIDQLVLTISQPIIAGSPAVTSNVNQPTNVDIIGSSTVNTGDVITVTILQAPSKGTAVINSDNTIGYTATAGTVGADTFQYEICNQCGLCSNSTVSIDILNEAPVITPPSAPITSLAGQSVTIPFSSFISDPNNNIDVNSIQIIAGPLSNAPASFDASFNLTIDYSNTPFGGTDQVTIQVCDQLGACSQIVLQIEVDGEIIAYNGISPNSDGFNDHFEIRNIQFLEPNNKVAIYNRWGDKVFEMDNYDSATADRRFEGRQNNGKELPSGVYFYKVEFISGRSSLNGYLTLKK